MGGCVSTSSSTCSSRSNGENISHECLGISMFGRKRTRRTFSDHAIALQHLSSIPNRIFANGKSRTSCIFTQQGRKGINQDAMIVWEDFMEDVTFCGVFDGHGPHGHLVAREVRDALPLKLLSFLKSFESKGDGSAADCCNGNPQLEVVDPDKDQVVADKVDTQWKEAFLQLYKAMDKELRSQPNLDCFCSGSTAVTLVKQGSDLYMGNIGDSRAILASKDDNNSMLAVQLTVDLKPDLPKEAERIKQCKGRVFALQDEPEVQRVWLPFDNAPGLAMVRAFGDFCLKEYGVISVPEFSHWVLTERDKFIVLASDGPPSRIKQCKGWAFSLQDEPEVQRVWLPFDNAPGLAMARAFGDFCVKEYGVISVPEFSHRVLTERDKFIVLASDGVWDVLSNEEVVCIVSSAPTRSSSAKIIVDSAARKWKIKYPTSKMDDCAVVCLIDHHQIVLTLKCIVHVEGQRKYDINHQLKSYVVLSEGGVCDSMLVGAEAGLWRKSDITR